LVGDLMADIISAFCSCFSFGSFLLLMFILSGVGIILKTFWGGQE